MGDSRITGVDVSTFTIPTETPESDGTIAWDSTTIVVVEVQAGGMHGIGYTYGHAASAQIADTVLSDVVRGRDVLDVGGIHEDMRRALRNIGRPGIGMMAVSAMDVALWDCKARLLEQPLVTLLGRARDAIECYGSGGFTSYTVDQLEAQLGDWVEEGMRAVKMKIGRRPLEDVDRVHAARHAIGDEPLLFVDANGAYTRKQALDKAYEFAEFGVTWFEEPVSSDDLEGLRLLRDRSPHMMEITAGEYGYEPAYFAPMLEAVDVVQPDGTRCGGVTGLLAVGAMCDARGSPLSLHTGPTLHGQVGCALVRARHVEYFLDHARIERMLFDGALVHDHGVLRPDLSRPGLGIELKRADAERFAA
ncbi:MAG TPA: enolase C-terminal domain-like protein [Actinomycetota bacterium]|nr:enolase C-terminal domain-like protein [Actinomycetota bacterium]